MTIERSRGSLAGSLVVAFAVVSMTASAASALTKVRSDVPLVTDPIVFSGFCPFPVTYQDLAGSGTQTLTFDEEGNLVRIDVRAHVVSRFTANGNTITFNNSGTLTVVPQPDGTDLVTLHGHSWNADQGLLTGDPFMAIATGRVVILSVYNPATGYNDFLWIEQNGRELDVCAALAE